MPRPKRNFGKRGERPKPHMREQTDLGRTERQCPESGKRMYSSKGQALRSGTERFGMTGYAYRCQECGFWHCTRSGTPLDADWRDRSSPAPSTEISDPELDALADRLVDLLGIGMHDDTSDAA